MGRYRNHAHLSYTAEQGVRQTDDVELTEDSKSTAECYG